MMKPAQAAIFAIGLILSGALSFCSIDRATASPITASNQTEALPAVKPAAAEAHPRVYLFRGALGPIFSRGIDGLTKKLEQAGITANIYEFTICRLIAERAIKDYHENPAPIVLIGHSMGGFCSLKFAEMCEAENIPISLIVAIDPAHVTPDVPLNVERFINIFLAKNVLGGGDVKPKQGYLGHYASFDMAQHDEVSHINIDKMDAVHQQLIAKIQELAKTPSKSEGEALPLRLVVPPGAAVELWDSGMPVFAREGDTLPLLAAQYHVPLWSLTQANKGVDNAPLMLGERIVVPRHLVPLTDVSGQSTRGR